ncbi:MAG: PDZ domain-containing protein [Bacteroidota bacterium]
MRKFWKLVAEDIAEKYGHENPGSWPAQIIYNVLDHMERQVIEACKADKKKAIACGIVFKDDVAHDVSKDKKWQIIDLTTFKRIFRDKRGGGQTRTQNIFAIGLGYRSVADYLDKKQAFTKSPAMEEAPLAEKVVEPRSIRQAPQQKRSIYIIVALALVGLILYATTNRGWLAFNPFLVTGIGLFLFFGIHRLIIRSGLIQPFGEKEGSTIVRLILKYGFYIALATTASGVLASGLGFWDKQQESVVAVEVIKEEVLEGCTEMAGLVWGVSRMVPKAYFEREAREFNRDYQHKVKEHYENYLGELDRIIHEYPLNTDVFKTYKLNLRDQAQATAFTSVYDHLKEANQQLLDWQKQLQELLSYTINNETFAQKITLKQQQKIVEARIALAKAGSEFVLLLQNETDIYLLNNALNMADFQISEKAPKKIWQQLQQRLAQLHREKQELLEQASGIPSLISQNISPPKDTTKPKADQLMDKADSIMNKLYQEGTLVTEEELVRITAPKAQRNLSGQIRNPYLQKNRAEQGLPPDQLTLAEKQRLNRKALDTTTTEPSGLLTLAVLAFFESDEEGVKYYLQKALKSPQLSPVQRQFFELSLQRMEEPDLYGESIGVMVLRILPGGALQAAGLLPGDVLFKVNGEYVQNTADISKLIVGKAREDVHFFEFYREGRYKSKSVPSNQLLGAQLSPLITWEPMQM